MTNQSNTRGDIGNNNHKIEIPLETSPPPALVTIVDDLQAQVGRLVNDYSSRIVELEAEVRQLVANQAGLEAKLRQLAATRDQNHSAKNTSDAIDTTTYNGEGEDDSNQNNEATYVFSPETRVREETTPVSLKAKLESHRSDIEDIVTPPFRQYQPEEEEIIFFATDIVPSKTARVREETTPTLATTRNDQFDEQYSTNINSMVNISADPSKKDSGEEGGDEETPTAKKLVTETIEGDCDDDNPMNIHLFVDSTNQYLFMETVTSSEGTTYKVKWNHKLIAVSVIIFQCCAYLFIGYLLLLAIKGGRDSNLISSPLEIDAKYCYDEDSQNNFYWTAANGMQYSNLAQASVTAETLPTLLRCTNPTDHLNWSEGEGLYKFNKFMSSLVIVPYILTNLFDIFFLFKTNGLRERLTGVLLLFQELLTVTISFLGHRNVVYVGFLDTFLLVVGLIFIHDIDEQIFKVMDGVESVRKNYRCLSLQFGIFFAGFVIAWNTVTIPISGLGSVYSLIDFLEGEEMI